MSIYHPPTRQTSARSFSCRIFSHRQRNNDRRKRRLFFETLLPHLWACTLQKQAKKKEEKRQHVRRKGELHQRSRGARRLRDFYAFALALVPVDEYSPRAIISASPQAQRLDSELVESIRRTNRGFDALRRRVDATTDSASELSTFENRIGMQTEQNYSALEVRYSIVIVSWQTRNE